MKRRRQDLSYLLGGLLMRRVAIVFSNGFEYFKYEESDHEEDNHGHGQGGICIT